MRLLDRYIAKNVLSAIALVTLMLAGLQIFILFVNQLGDLGRSNYGFIQAASFVCLQMPYQVYLFFPMASLLGCLIGLGVMANHRELVVMRASGMSIGQVTIAVIKVAMVVIIAVTLFGETLVPKLSHLANDAKLQALSDVNALRTARGVWLRQKNDFIFIGEISQNNRLLGVTQFHFDKSHALSFVRKIAQINYQNGVWFAEGIEQTEFQEEKTMPIKLPNMVWKVSIKPSILSVTSSEPDEMTLNDLYQYVKVQKKNHQSAVNYQLAYLQRLIQPLTTMVMMVLAIPFIFGPLRESTMGSKLLTGAIVGFGFHMINRFFGPFSQVFQWPPEIAAFLPTAVFALIGLYLMRRVK